jgi:hypothetical protein
MLNHLIKSCRQGCCWVRYRIKWMILKVLNFFGINTTYWPYYHMEKNTYSYVTYKIFSYHTHTNCDTRMSHTRYFHTIHTNCDTRMSHTRYFHTIHTNCDTHMSHTRYFHSIHTLIVILICHIQDTFIPYTH